MTVHIKHTIFYFILLTLLSITTSVSSQSIYSIDQQNEQIHWKLKPQIEVGADSIRMFAPGYSVSNWVDAVVPGTVFSSYVAAGLEKDPNFGDNIEQVDKTKYNRNYWYRTEFNVPASFDQEKIWLHFEGVNRRGQVFLNGSLIGQLDGFMDKGLFDVTKVIKTNQVNILAVLVSTPQPPMANFASPTYVSSGGWDWMPTVPGLNAGITDNVFLTNSGKTILENPWIRTLLPTNSRADLIVSTGIRNATLQNVQAELTGLIQPGNITFTQLVNVEANRTVDLKLDKNTFAQLSVHQPKLWWPNGYGEPNLYTCRFTLKVDGKVSDSQTVTFGMKQYTYDTDGGVLHVRINGVKVFLKGGNWGMSEYMLRVRGKAYDTRIRLHKEMNYNIIRNWIGSTTDEEFYDACDKYGIMVWDDFWLNSNPVLPEDIHCFNANAIEKIKRFRNHPSIAVWCGDNEGWPEAPLNNWLKEDVRTFDGNDRYYQANSHEENLTGSGYWGNRNPKWYFTPYPESIGGSRGWGLRTEIGTAVFPNLESLRKFMPEDKLWPRNEMWGKHFFGDWAFNATPDYYEQSLTERYGKPTGIDDFCRKAQLLNLETNKAMYEGWLDHMWEDASGIMIWMSQSAFPSMIWQTYDYYYDLTGAYWGVKSACEPIHIQWNPLDNSVKVINTTAKNIDNLKAEIAVFNMGGSEMKSYGKTTTLNSSSNTSTQCFVIPFNEHPKNLAFQKTVIASSTGQGSPEMVTDGDDQTRWCAKSTDDEWIAVDLGKIENVNGVGLNWESAAAKKYKIQVSNDLKNWKTVYTLFEGREGKIRIDFEDQKVRYVRMLGLERLTWWGYSLWNFEVYGAAPENSDLTDVHFIKLKLRDASGKILSENFYWRGSENTNFTALNNLSDVSLKSEVKTTKQNDRTFLQARISNPGKTVAFAVWVQLRNSKTKERILPALISDNYFTLMPGETKDIHAEFDSSLLKPGDNVVLEVKPYNQTPN
ncbi:MAG TPA: discoidin domain-containing protein [Bacteroidales bacterium]|nr:discoidin domain-containing protein [Bacteroidales bacterium]